MEIGLSAEWLKEQAISDAYPFRLLRVVYHPKKQIELVSSVLDLAINEVSSILSEVEEEALEGTLSLMLTILQRLAAEFSPVVKNPAYSDEREWRLLSFGDPMNVRSVKGNFVQFTTINLSDPNGNHPFREIKLAPGNNPEIEKPAVELLLRKLELEKDVQLSSSIIPIRAT